MIVSLEKKIHVQVFSKKNNPPKIAYFFKKYTQVNSVPSVKTIIVKTIEFNVYQ
jgi:hypothetical protein